MNHDPFNILLVLCTKLTSKIHPQCYTHLKKHTCNSSNMEYTIQSYNVMIIYNDI